MKLHQFKLFKAIVDNGLNMSHAAESLLTSQPGISKQIKMFEEELGVDLFVRTGKHLTSLTPVGQAILSSIELILQETENIRRIAEEHKNDNQGKLRIATTHTQARYILPTIIQYFREQYPEVQLELHQGTPDRIADLASSGNVDFAIATEALEDYDNLIMMPAYRWNRVLIVPKDHPILNDDLSLETLSTYPLVTYIRGYTGRSQLDHAFTQAGLEPNIVLTAADADVIKTYVREGFGVGVLARTAYADDLDQDLVMVNAEHLFNWSTVNIGFRKGLFLRSYMYTFIECFAGHLTKSIVDAHIQAKIEGSKQPIVSISDLPHL